jgi:hypothetical protein
VISRIRRSPVVAWNRLGEPIALANGRTREDGRCRTEQHAFPDLPPQINWVENDVAVAETCISCRTIRSILVAPNGVTSRARYFYPGES